MIGWAVANRLGQRESPAALGLAAWQRSSRPPRAAAYPANLASMPKLPPPADPDRRYVAVLDTSAGEIRCELFAADAPQTVGNFVGLAGQGFYDGTIFHRVIADFMIQGGCPQGTGTGGPGYQFADEINDHKLVRGTLAMANAGPNTNGSQFFLVTAEATPWLDGHHTAFGRVVSGQEVLDAIGATPTARGDRPVNEQRLVSVRVEENA
jgi:cyclophilin family peptidyl-prolyl cis-trans isomerase